jgi:sugar/nucleoside kinase (ribokinase family)
MDPAVEVVAVGHAIVDVLSPSDDSLVSSLGLEKGTMTLVDEEQSEKIYASLGPASEASGGSAANTAACLASLGASVRFVGRVRDDGLGRVFTHDIRAIGVHFDVPPATSGPATGRCMIMVTPDAEKTMCTNLGAGALLEPSDIDLDAVAAARVLYLEGYLCGDGHTAAAVDVAVSAARDAGTLVAFSGSDPAWVEFQGDALRALAGRADILFANEQEALGLAQTGDLDEAIRRLRRRCPTVAVTLGARGCVVASEGGTVTVPAAPVARVVDTTGAGDSFAAGFLYGVVTGKDPEVSARLGALAAGEVVSHIGARPLAHLEVLAGAAGLL